MSSFRKKASLKGLLGLLFGLALMALIPSVVQAQTPTGGIEGLVTDPAGAAIPGATVVITETATSRAITMTTTEAGLYSARNLLPGIYSVRVEMAGFTTKKIENVSVSTGQVVNGDVQLEVGQPQEVVEVLAQTVAVDTVRQTVDTVVNEREIKDMPNFGRNFLELAALAPGAYLRDGGDIDPTKEKNYRVVGVSGRSGTATRVQVDGIDVTDETVGTTVANFSIEGVQEFQLTRSSLDPSTSLTSSGAVNIISKGGGNEIHGSGFFDYFNEGMRARPGFLDVGPGGSNPEDRRKRYGGAVGGPFVKEKMFWFVSGERTDQTGLERIQVPEFPQLDTNQSFPLTWEILEGRFDWNISSPVRMFYKAHHDNNLATGGTAVSPFQNVNWTNIHTAGLDVGTSRMTHAYRFGYVNFNNRIQSQELDFKFPRTPNGIPYFLDVGNYDAGPNSLAPQETDQDNIQNSYEGSWFVDKHTLRFGFDVRRIVLGGYACFAGPLTVGGTYDVETIAAVRARGGNVQDPLEYPFEYLSVGPANGYFTLAPAHNLPHGGHYNNRIAWFVQDSWKIVPQFTLNLGLRWNYDTQYYADPDVPRDPILETWGTGYSRLAKLPKDLFSPSLGFAWDVMGNGKTVIRGGMYRGYEMNIQNNTMFDEFSMLPGGLGPDLYGTAWVSGPDGTPINADGNHPDGNYEDLIGRPIKEIIGIMGQLKAAVDAAYNGYQFDPTKGESAFRLAQGVTYGGTIPGDFRIPYALQFNLGVQRELAPSTVLSVDWVYNHAVGLPFFLTDREYRRDSRFLDVAAARAKMDSVLKGQTVAQWIAANPTRNISAFGLINDTIWPGASGTDFLRARFMDGGFAKYQALQFSLRGMRPELWKFRDLSYNVSYALGRGESSAAQPRVEFTTNPVDNRWPNNPLTFGPNSLDFTSMLTVANLMTIPGGFQLNSFWRFRSAPPANIYVPNMGGAISGTQGFFGIDLNGDGSAGTSPRNDVLPGIRSGQFGREVKSLEEMNEIIQAFNTDYAGKLTPHGQALVAAGLFTEAELKSLGAVIPTIPLIPAGNPNPWHNLFTTDLRIARAINLPGKEGLRIEPFIDIFNLFNHAPVGVYSSLSGRFGALNFDYAKADEGERASDLDITRGRINPTRHWQFGFRVTF